MDNALFTPNMWDIHRSVTLGSEVLAVTSKGIYFSKNEGRTWAMRYSLPTCGDFYNLIDGGRELLANTSKGLYYSTNSGRTWSFRKK